MYQQITIVGNVGRDPEMRYTASGVPVTSFSVATNRQWTGQDGQQHDKTVWFRITAWRRQAEVASQYITKGQQILVIGEVEEPQAYTDKEGNPRASLDVTAIQFKFIGRRGDSMTPIDTNSPGYSNERIGAMPGTPSSPSPAAATSAPAPGMPAPDGAPAAGQGPTDEEIPF